MHFFCKFLNIFPLPLYPSSGGMGGGGGGWCVLRLFFGILRRGMKGMRGGRVVYIHTDTLQTSLFARLLSNCVTKKMVLTFF